MSHNLATVASAGARWVGRVAVTLALCLACFVSSEAASYAAPTADGCGYAAPTASATPTPDPTSTVAPTPVPIARVCDGQPDTPYYVALTPDQFSVFVIFGASVLLLMVAGFFLRHANLAFINLRRGNV